MELKWSIRTYKEGDQEGIFELSKKTYPERTHVWEDWIKWWHWMYRENPVSPAQIWLAERQGKIIGQYPLIFMNLKVGDHPARISQNIDVMTHPAYRGQGIFSRLERRALDEAEKAEVYITIGFPNEAAYPGHIKSGWFDIARMQIAFKPLDWGNTLTARISNKLLVKLGATTGSLAGRILLRAEKAPIVEGLTITQTSRFDERINYLWSKVADQNQIMVVRDEDYLNWRYVAAPGMNYLIYLAEKAGEIYGYLVLRIRQGDRRAGVICDVLAQSKPIAQSLISNALEHCQQEKVDVIYCSLIANRIYREAFRRSGFMFAPFVQGAMFCAYSSAPSISRDFLKNPKNWFVQMGDSDTV